jgi:hypothetical protein
MKSARTPALLAALLLAGCQTDSTGAPSAQAKPLTHQEAALQCWMATEHGHADMSLDKRADVVDACIKDKMAGKPWPAAAQPKAKPKATPAAAPKS